MNLLGLSPAGKIACSVVLVASVATSDPSSSRVRVAVGVLVLAVFALARPDLLVLARRLLVALGAIVALCVPFAIAGDLPRAFELAGRAGAATLIALAFASTLALDELPSGLRALGLPLDFVSTVHAMLWQVGNIGNEGQRLVLARRLRGARGVVGPEILAELLVRTTARAERVDLAMQLRGTHSELAAHGSRLKMRDILGIGCAFCIGIALHLIRET